MNLHGVLEFLFGRHYSMPIRRRADGSSGVLACCGVPPDPEWDNLEDEYVAVEDPQARPAVSAEQGQASTPSTSRSPDSSKS